MEQQMGQKTIWHKKDKINKAYWQGAEVRVYKKHMDCVPAIIGLVKRIIFSLFIWPTSFTFNLIEKKTYWLSGTRIKKI